ncbi:uncharacterized protein LOC143913498 isoform X3 [Arctopsyche grandis]|uniref:uncharacterized protein LOC143913498 isoform X3 n=1 Tax=Arctopsyche grandis TaxID=121162 RepID=UPI00406D7A93
MECRLCLFSAPADGDERLVSIHGDPHPPHLAQRIWTCCRLQVRKGDELPDTICRSCVNNLESLDSFRSACLRSDEASRVPSGVKLEEVLLDDLTWEDESAANFSPNTSSWPDDGQTRGGKTTSDDGTIEVIATADTPEASSLRKVHIERPSCTTTFITRHTTSAPSSSSRPRPFPRASSRRDGRQLPQHLHGPQRLTVQLGIPSSTISMPLPPPPPHQPTAERGSDERRLQIRQHHIATTTGRPTVLVATSPPSNVPGGTPTQRMTHVNKIFSLPT